MTELSILLMDRGRSKSGLFGEKDFRSSRGAGYNEGLGGGVTFGVVRVYGV